MVTAREETNISVTGNAERWFSDSVEMTAEGMNGAESRVIPESLGELIASGTAAVYCLSGGANSAMDEFCCTDDLVCRTLVSIAGDHCASLFEGFASVGTEVRVDDGIEGMSRERVCF